MPLYFFDTDDGTNSLHDTVGTECADDQAARDVGARAMGELAKDYLPGGDPQKNITMWIRNEKGEAILQLAMTFAIRPVT